MDDPAAALAEYRRVLRPGGTLVAIEGNRFNPVFYVHMTKLLGHEHFSRELLPLACAGQFPDARFGAFEAHYVPWGERLLGLQHVVEERSSASPSATRSSRTTSPSHDAPPREHERALVTSPLPDVRGRLRLGGRRGGLRGRAPLPHRRRHPGARGRRDARSRPAVRSTSATTSTPSSRSTPPTSSSRGGVSYLQRLADADALGGDGAPLVDVAVGGSGYTVIEAARARAPCDRLRPLARGSARREAIRRGRGRRRPRALRLLLGGGAAARIRERRRGPGDRDPRARAGRRRRARRARPRPPAAAAAPGSPSRTSSARSRRCSGLPNRLHDRRLGHLRSLQRDRARPRRQRARAGAARRPVHRPRGEAAPAARRPAAAEDRPASASGRWSERRDLAAAARAAGACS